MEILLKIILSKRGGNCAPMAEQVLDITFEEILCIYFSA